MKSHPVVLLTHDEFQSLLLFKKKYEELRQNNLNADHKPTKNLAQELSGEGSRSNIELSRTVASNENAIPTEDSQVVLDPVAVAPVREDVQYVQDEGKKQKESNHVPEESSEVDDHEWYFLGIPKIK